MKQSNENLLGYLLNALDETSRREVEAYLAASAEAQGRLEFLRRALEPLAADQEETAPPGDLLYRTLGRVAEYACRRDLPRAPAPPRDQIITYRSPWRRAEVLVAASILIVALGTAVSGLVQLRHSSAFVECKDNLRVFYAALRPYHVEHKHFPDVTAEAPHNVAGMMVPILVNAGVLDSAHVSVRCPGNGGASPCPVTYENTKDLSEDEFSKVAPRLMSWYAYSLGYFDQAGTYHAPHLSGRVDSHIPLMSDRPPFGNDMGNSPNHGGTGQNVLFQDGHVAYLTTRSLGFDEDIFLNQAHEERAGRDVYDGCLGRSAARP
jgi:prepilin-type processing-associated H-X9-DG protein